MKRFLLLFACLCAPPIVMADMNPYQYATAPIVAADTATLKTFSGYPEMNSGWIDAAPSANGDGCFLTTHSIDHTLSGIPETLRHVRTCGTPDAPYTTKVWIKKTCQREPVQGRFCTDQTSGSFAFTSFAPGLNDVVSLWFTSIFNVGGSERLAFVHEENVGNSGFTGSNWVGRTRIGLAYSADSGHTWRYLGRIAKPYQDPDNFNIQGAPYYTYNDQFYVWYRDRAPSEGMAVSRANVSAVIAAARQGHLGTNLWEKWTPGGWSTDIGAQPALPSPEVQEIIHTQAAHSADGNYYALTTIQTGGRWGTPNSRVSLYTINPATLQWTKKFDIANEPTSAFRSGGDGKGYQYASILDASGRADGEVGTSFYVLAGKVDSYSSTGGIDRTALYQWKVHTTAPQEMYKTSRAFLTGPQAQWPWEFAALSAGTHMTWNPSLRLWEIPADPFNRVYEGGMSTGATDNFLLIWTAPRNGAITVRQTVRAAAASSPCGDGVNFAAQVNSTPFFSGHIDPDDSLGYGQKMQLNVAAGDHLFFYGTKGADHYCDNLLWDPSVSYD